MVVPAPQERPVPDDSRQRVNYRLTKTPEEIAAEAIDEEKDYSSFVLGAANAALLLFTTQALASMFVGDYLGATIQIEFQARVIPTLQFITDIPTFVKIVTWSTAIAVVMTCVGVLVALARRRGDNQRIYGWAMGLLMAGLLVVFHFIRHLMRPPVIDGWVIAQSTAFIIVTALIFVGFKPGTPLPETTDARAQAALLERDRRMRRDPLRQSKNTQSTNKQSKSLTTSVTRETSRHRSNK